MILVSDAIQELGVDKTSFLSLYSDLFGKELSKKDISQKDFDKIKTHKNTGSDNIGADSKILKSAEIFGGGFFSGMFGSTAVQEQKKEEEEEKKAIIEENKEDNFIMDAAEIGKNRAPTNAKVLKRFEGSNVNKNDFDKFVQQKKDQSDRFRSRSNISFQNSIHRPDKKNVNGVASKNSRFQNRHATEDKSKNKTQINNEPKKIKEAKTSETLSKKSEIIIGDIISVKELSEKMGIQIVALMKIMLQNKILGGINTVLDFDTASLLATEFDVIVKKQDANIGLENVLSGDLQAILNMDKFAENKKLRAPIVTIMGHVDHGKTSLLDYIRKTNVANGEAGGITQSIGASMISYDDKFITFIDTPGHELFTSLRARGSKITNIVVIIIAIEDGVMPQTIESISHAKEANVPIIVAITKIDKIGTDQRAYMLEKIKSDLGKYEIITEDRGGNVPLVQLSSKTGEGVEELLENILLISESLDLQYNPDRKSIGVVVDAKKDPKQGVIASLILLTGNLKVGDIIVTHDTYGKVKKMLNTWKKPVQKAFGGEPVMILGLSEVPEPGRIIEVVEKEKDAQSRIVEIQSQNIGTSQSTVQKFMDRMKDGDDALLKLILKSDGHSSLEALNQSIDQIIAPETVKIKKIHSSIGIINDSDLDLAKASDAVIVGFNTQIPSNIKKKSDQLHISMKNFDIIYELVEYIEDLVNGLIKIEKKEVNVGTLNVLGVFFKKEKQMVIGGKVTDGMAKNGCKFRIVRDGEEIGKGEINSLQKDKQNVSEVPVGHECGMRVKVSKKIEFGDLLEFFVIE